MRGDLLRKLNYLHLFRKKLLLKCSLLDKEPLQGFLLQLKLVVEVFKGTHFYSEQVACGHVRGHHCISDLWNERQLALSLEDSAVPELNLLHHVVEVRGDESGANISIRSLFLGRINVKMYDIYTDDDFSADLWHFKKLSKEDLQVKMDVFKEGFFVKNFKVFENCPFVFLTKAVFDLDMLCFLVSVLIQRDFMIHATDYVVVGRPKHSSEFLRVLLHAIFLVKTAYPVDPLENYFDENLFRATNL